MSQGNRFDQLLKTAKQQKPPTALENAAAPLDVQTSERSDTQASKQLNISAPKHLDVQTSEHSDTQISEQPNISISKAKSSSKDFKRTTVYLTQALHRKLKQASLDHGIEMSDIAEAAIAQWIDEHSSNLDV